MLTEEVKKVVEGSAPSEDVVLIVSVSKRPDDSEVFRHKDRKSRRDFVDLFYSRAKEPLLAQVQSLQPLGARIVDVLHGTPQMVVSAPASTWREAINREDSFFLKSDVTLFPNERAFGLPDQTSS